MVKESGIESVKAHQSRLHLLTCSFEFFLVSLMANLKYGFTVHFQILNLAHNKSDIERRVHAVIDKFAERGLRSLAVAYQVFLIFYRAFIYESVHCRTIMRLQI